MLTTEKYFGQNIVDEGTAANAVLLLAKVNEFLADFLDHFPEETIRMSSGYRSREHNLNVGGALDSNHMKGRAVDVADYSRNLAKFCLQNIPRLEQLGLYCEDLRVTKNWVHFQSTPPKSGRRFFIPSIKYVGMCEGPLTLESLNV